MRLANEFEGKDITVFADVHHIAIEEDDSVLDKLVKEEILEIDELMEDECEF